MILLDTHVLLWLRTGDARLGPMTRRVIGRAENEGEVAVSAEPTVSNRPAVARFG